jgi:hypothetical protein
MANIAGKLKDEEWGLTMICQQLKELKWDKMSITKGSRQILSGIKASRLKTGT